MTIDDTLSMWRVNQHQASPNGDSVVFVASRPEPEHNRNQSQLFVQALAGGEPRRLTREGSSNSDPAFSPDGAWIAYSSNRSGVSQVWLMPLAGGEPRQLTRLRLGARRPVWLPDGRGLLVTSPVLGEAASEQEIERLEERRASERKLGPAPRIIEQLMFRHWDEWLDGRIDHLFVVDVETGETRDLTPGPWPVPPLSLTGEPDYAPSPDGQQVCFVSLRDAPLASSTNTNLWLVPTAGGEPRRISPFEGCNAYPVWSPDGRTIAYCGMRRAGFESDRRELLVYELASARTHEPAPGFDRSVGPPVWSPDGRRLYFSAQDQGTTRIWELPAEGGDPRPLSQGATDHDPRLTPDGRWLLFARESLQAPPELHRMAVAGGEPEPLTRLNAEVLETLDLPDAEDFWFEGARGERVHGMLLRPPGFRSDTRYPVVFLIHGGPQAMFGRDFHPRWSPQLFAARGWVTVTINPRGSTGYGQAFTDAIRGEWGGACYEDLVRGFDHVLDSYRFCDGERMAAAGASFGGFMVNWIAGHSDRFRCLVSHDGIFNTETMNWATEELWFTEWEFEGLPWESPEAYRRWSPHLHVERMRTPMLIIHGARDYRCVDGEGLQLFTALRRRGTRARLLYFEDEGHWVLKPRNRKLWWDTVLDWLDEHLRQER